MLSYLESEIEERPERGRVHFSRDSTIRTVSGDIRLLRHALIKLLNNALEAIRERGEVHLYVRPSETDGWVELECVDTGAGMTAQTLEQASDPFFTTRASGVGLGLALVRKAAELHGGGMSIESEVETGTRVVMYFPREEVRFG